MNSRQFGRWLSTAMLFAAFLLVVLGYGLLESAFPAILARRGIMIERVPLWISAVQHLYIVAISSTLSIVVAMLVGISVFFPAGRALKDLFIELSSFGETFPSVAIIALTVPVLGYGFWPTVIALFIYGILPVLRNTITGIENVEPGVIDAARGMGMYPLQMITRVALPMAFPVIVAGIRTSVIINIGAATIGATVGAGGFGVPIISGIRSGDYALVLRGSIPVALLALAVDSLFRNFEHMATREDA